MKLSYIFILIFMGWVDFNITYYIFGYLGFIRARKITKEDLEKIESYGISHCTTNKGKIGICRDKLIKGSRFRKAYSNHFKKGAYFFSNYHVTSTSYDFNNNPKYRWTLNITNLTDEQLNNLRIRTYDNALIYLGNFNFCERNCITWSELNVKENKWYQKLALVIKSAKDIRPDKYVIGIFSSLILSSVLLFGLTILLVVVINYKL